jgi:hypothetical protein
MQKYNSVVVAVKIPDEAENKSHLQDSDTTFARNSTTVMVTPCLHNHNFLVRESGIEAGYSVSRITILHFNIVARIFDSFDS